MRNTNKKTTTILLTIDQSLLSSNPYAPLRYNCSRSTVISHHRQTPSLRTLLHTLIPPLIPPPHFAETENSSPTPRTPLQMTPHRQAITGDDKRDEHEDKGRRCDSWPQSVKPGKLNDEVHRGLVLRMGSVQEFPSQRHAGLT